MPFPTDQQAMFDAGYVYARVEACSVCGLWVEVWTTPGKREVQMEPMVSSTSSAVRHYYQCNIAPKQEEQNGSQQLRHSEANVGTKQRYQDGNRPSEHEGSESGIANHNGDSRECFGSSNVRRIESVLDPVQQETVRRDIGGNVNGIKIYGVTDRNMIAVGWQDGTLRIQFPKSAWDYFEVPENVFVTIRKVPYPYSYFTKAVKGKYRGEKIS